MHPLCPIRNNLQPYRLKKNSSFGLTKFVTFQDWMKCKLQNFNLITQSNHLFAWTKHCHHLMTVLTIHNDQYSWYFQLSDQQQKRHLTEMWTKQGWDLIFRMMLNDWELHRATEFYGTSENIGGLQEGAINSGGMGIVVVHTMWVQPMKYWIKPINRLRIGLGSTTGRQRYHVACFVCFQQKRLVLTLTWENLKKRGISLYPTMLFMWWNSRDNIFFFIAS